MNLKPVPVPGGVTPSTGRAPAPLAPPPLPDTALGGAPSSGGPPDKVIASVNNPAARPASNVKPQVIVYDETEYVCKPDDTFEKISARFFSGADKYAKALQRHNQQHARASDRMIREGTLTAGEKIFIPPADILEQRYGDAIGKPVSPTAGSGTLPVSPPAPGASSAPPSRRGP